jgi:hypothetical protein
MNHERLNRLADLLDTVKPEKFSLKAWYCGSAACAVGHAALSDQFPELTRSENCPKFGSYTSGWTSVEAYFDVSMNVAERLFQATSYDDSVKPCDVSARIREELANDGAAT